MQVWRRKAAWAAAFAAAAALWRPQLLALLGAALRDIALPPLWGALLALALQGPCRRLQRLFGGTRAARSWALAVCYAALAAAAGGTAALLAPQLAQSVLALAGHSAEYAARLKALLAAAGQRMALPAALEEMRGEVAQRLFLWLSDTLQRLAGGLLALGGNVARGILQLLLGMFFSLYLLTDGPALAAQAASALQVWLPARQAQRLLAFAALCRQMVQGWLVGQILDCLLLGAACGAGMALLRLPFAALVGLLCGVCNLVPLIGGPLGGVLGALLLLPIRPLQALWFVVYYLVLQQLEGRFLYPRIVGSRLGLPPLLVLLAVLCGSELGGVPGMLLALPAAAVAYAAARSATHARRAAGAPTQNEVCRHDTAP